MNASRWLAGSLLLVLALLAGCEEKEAPPPARNGLQVPVYREFRGQQGPFPDRAFMVIQRPEAWRALWGTQQPPDVDFTNQSVIAVMMGREPTTGYGITISDVRATGEGIDAYVDETQPQKGDVVAQVITYPYHMVVVPKLTQPVTFIVNGVTAPVAPITDQFIGTSSRAVAPQTLVIRNQEGWRRLWETTLGLTTAPPEIDFACNMAVAVLAGQRPTGGYAASITSITQEDDRLIVRYQIRTPLPGEIVTQALTSPYAIAIIPASQLPVVFRDVSAVSTTVITPTR